MSNMEITAVGISAVIGVVAAYFVSDFSSIYSTLMVLIGASWLSYRILYPGKWFSTLGMFLSPPKNTLIWFFSSFIYLTFRQSTFVNAFIISLGVSLLAFAVGITFHSIWNPE